MRTALALIAPILLCTELWAETVVATRTIRAQELILGSDLKVVPGEAEGMAQSISEVAGLEARRIIYAGRPIAFSQIGPPALIERNQIVTLGYRINSLVITTDGRALARAGYGDRIRVLNLESRATVSGTVDATGNVWVSQ